MEPGRYALHVVLPPHLPPAQVEAVVAWNGGAPFDVRRGSVLDFFADSGLVVTCPCDEVEVLERALDLNVYVMADGRLLEDVWVLREDRSILRTRALLGMITCRYTSGADVVLHLERDGYRRKRVTPVESLDPMLGCAVIELVRDSAATHPRRAPSWYVDWTMPCAGLVEGAVIPVRMVLGDRLRGVHSTPSEEEY